MSTTPSALVALAIRAADEIDRERPTLRRSGAYNQYGKPAWIYAVAQRANTLKTDRGIEFGVKDAGAGRPVSYDTIGIRADNSGRFFAVSLCRDELGVYPRRLEDSGLVGGEQRFYTVEPEDVGSGGGTGGGTGDDCACEKALAEINAKLDKLSVEHLNVLNEIRLFRENGVTIENSIIGRIHLRF